MKNKMEIDDEIKTKNRTDVREKSELTNNSSVSCSGRVRKFLGINSPVSWTERVRNFLNFFTVEPFLLCYILPNSISGLAVQKLNMEKACLVDLNYTESVCARVTSGDLMENITKEAQSAAVKMVADMSAWQSPLQSSIPAIMILFVGAWSDRTGNRKLLMLVPMIGELISSFGLILTTYYFHEWPLWVTALIEALPTALSGGLSVVLMGSYSFMADVTTLESRTFRIGVVAVIVTLGMPLGTSISGVLTEAVGYYGVFGIALTLYVLGFIHTCFRVHNVRNDKVGGTLFSKLISFFHPRNVWDTVSIIFLTPTKQRIQIILIIIVHIVILGPVFGEVTVLYLYTLSRYSMNVVDFSLFNTYNILMGIAGTAVAVTVFSKLLKLHDTFLGIIATACKTVSSFVYGSAPTRYWFFAGPVFDFFGNSGVTAIRSLGTKIVDPDKVGKMCSLIGFAEALIPIMYPPLYSKVFSNTVDTVPGAVYYLGGAMTIPAFFIFIFLFIMSEREKRDTVTDPVAKEMHTYDNDVSVL